MTTKRETEKVSGIYKIINKVNGKYYVGSSNNIHKRWKYHKEDLLKNKHHSQYLQRSWNKYGPEAFDFVIIEIRIPEKDLLITEQKYLDISSNEKNKCYNSSFIAGKIEMNETTRKKISISNTGKKHSKETKQKLREIALKQFENGMPEETKRKISENSAMNGLGKHWHHTEEAKRKISKGLKGKYVGQLASMYGKHHTEEWKRIRKEKWKVNPLRLDKTIYNFKNTNTGESFTGTQLDFRMLYGLNKANLCRVIKGIRKSCGGWMLVQEEKSPLIV